ncbi:hypothetical protein [Arthrobacter sp. zg-Y1143]|uniref:hypothetical protein n=1 Tax=Arthrobacter sp. zg-Y1143 TaxID=3049065 RepID=UPI0024C27F50|nr:hypothetical protein [Arthrobacter sp. zg-Y1143]MDK1329046.1 hypothetical protein [Arthrobacter sp. zg-Y1143]
MTLQSSSHSGLKLLWIDTVLCDAEDDPDIIERYLQRFLLTMESIGAQTIPDGADFRFTVNLSRDKLAYLPRIEQAICRLGAAHRHGTRVHLYDHPPGGYGVPASSHIDSIKNPNKQPGRREALFAAAAAGENFGRYESLVRISMDDDDLYFPGHLSQISAFADALLVSHPESVSAAGLYRQNLATVTPAGISMRDVDFNRVIPGNKFFVIPASHVPNAARYSPWAIPELIDEDAVERFAGTGVNLVLVRNNAPTFVYMRRAANLSLQSKDACIDNTHAEQEFSNEEDLLDHLRSSPAEPARVPVMAPLPREFRLTCSRAHDGTVNVSTNFDTMFGPGHRIAFYLMHGAERLDVRWYSGDGSAQFTHTPPGCTVRAFVQYDGEIIARKGRRVFG